MRHVRALFASVGQIVSPVPADHPYFPLKEYNSSSDSDSNSDDDDDDPNVQQQVLSEVADPIYDTEEAANRAFLQCYLRYMEHHLGRAPVARTDLYCAMFPIDRVQLNGQPSIRYWWMFYKHPMAVLLDQTYECEEVFDSYLGEVVIYQDDVVRECVDTLVDAYESMLNIQFQHVESGYEKEVAKHDLEDSVSIVVIEGGGEEDEKKYK
jgi:hypothetical protein